jgi:hypothetical protein
MRRRGDTAVGRIKVLAELVIRGAHWALPFIVVLAVSSMLAYAVDGALVAGAAVEDTASPVKDVCGGGVIYAGVNSWIPEGTPPSCAIP